MDEWFENQQNDDENPPPSPPPLFSDEEGEVDAFFVEVDGQKIKESNWGAYNNLLQFVMQCSHKCALRLFTHPGSDSEEEGALLSVEGKELEGDDYLLNYASVAITKYNHLNKDAKLRLEKLMKVNIVCWDCDRYYLTFSAVNENTGEVGIYQAALRNSTFTGTVLGLFRDCTADKILAIISIPGAEEDLAAKKKVVEDAIASARRAQRVQQNPIKI